MPPNFSVTDSAIIGRNYDYPAPFNLVAQLLTITLLFPNDATPTALISLPGQIYCPTCVSSAGLFFELNAAMPSGGWATVDVPSLLVGSLTVVQPADTLDQASTALAGLITYYSLVINVADAMSARSIEYSTTSVTSKIFVPTANTPFVSTNYFQNLA